MPAYGRKVDPHQRATWHMGVASELHQQGEIPPEEVTMPRIFDRRSQRTIGVLDADEYAMFLDLLQQPDIEDESPQIDASAVERLESLHASDNLLLIVRQVLDGGDDLDLGWED
jgi:hypothetical protein